MGNDNPSPPRSVAASRAVIEQRIAHTALEVSYAVMRAEDYRECLVSQAYLLFRADAGVGLTCRPSNSAAADQLTVVIAGAPPLSSEQILGASPFASRHPGFLAMARAGTTAAIRVSDHTNLARFWTTETYWRMHGHSDGRYPASALLLNTPDIQIFVGIHRHDRDFSDADLAGLGALQRPIAAALAFRAALDDTVLLLRHSSSPVSGEPEFVPGRRRTLDAAVRLCSDYSPTRREGEVLALVAQGWTNYQIGRRLGITERTVRKHLTAVYDKAGARGRAAAAAWWQRLNA
jgi:DNA-binding CsgD family transcriptional regulator